MAITVNNTTKIVTINGTSESTPQTIASIVDAIAAVDPSNASRTFNTAWIGGTWQIAFSTFTDFVIISNGFTLELRSLAAFQMNGSFILDHACTIIIARSEGLGFGNLACFQNSACKLVSMRLASSINPKVVIDCQGFQRSDIFGSADTSVLPSHNIQGLDLIFRDGNTGFVKAYFSSTAIAENINVSGSVLQLWSNSTTELNCPVFSDLLFTSNAIPGDLSSESRYVRFEKSTHLSNGPIASDSRASYFVFVDPVFAMGIPTNYGPSTLGNYQSGLDIRYSYALSVFEENGAPVSGANIRFKRSDGLIVNASSNNAGIVDRQELLYRQAPSTSGTSRPAGTLATFQWQVKGRSYNYLQNNEIYTDGEVTYPQSRSITMITDPNINLTITQSLALTGIVFNFALKSITMTGQSVGNLYHYYKALITNPAQFDVIPFISISGSIMTISDGWSMDIDGGTFSGSSTIKSVVVSAGSFSLTNSAKNTIIVTDSSNTYYPQIEFTGFPTSANSNGASPDPVFGIKNENTGVWSTFNASSGIISVSLSQMGTIGDTFTIVADAKGYYRTPEINGVGLDFVGQDFSNLFEEVVDSEGNALYGKGIQSEKDRITYNNADLTFDLDGGPISFNSALDKKEELTSTQAALTSIGTDVLRSMRFSQNSYSKTLQLPPPLKIRANGTTSTAPILTDFIVVVVGDLNADPYIHSSRPEVQFRLSKIISDPDTLSNLKLIPALL